MQPRFQFKLTDLTSFPFTEDVNKVGAGLEGSDGGEVRSTRIPVGTRGKQDLLNLNKLDHLELQKNNAQRLLIQNRRFK